MKRKNCADGGKLKPTFVRSVMEKVGIGDGYGNPKTMPKKPVTMTVANATNTFADTMEKRKKALDFKNGGKVTKNKR